MAPRDDGWKRRDLLRAVGVAVAATAAGGSGPAVDDARRPTGRDPSLRALVPGATPSARSANAPAEVMALFGEAAPGCAVGPCTLVSVHAPLAGAIPVILATSKGTMFQVDVLRREAGERGPIATTSTLSVWLCNGGDGAQATDEEQGLGAMALATVLARHETTVRAPSLATFRERAERAPQGSLRVPLPKARIV